MTAGENRREVSCLGSARVGGRDRCYVGGRRQGGGVTQTCPSIVSHTRGDCGSVATATGAREVGRHSRAVSHCRPSYVPRATERVSCRDAVVASGSLAGAMGCVPSWFDLRSRPRGPTESDRRHFMVRAGGGQEVRQRPAESRHYLGQSAWRKARRSPSRTALPICSPAGQSECCVQSRSLLLRGSRR